MKKSFFVLFFVFNLLIISAYADTISDESSSIISSSGKIQCSSDGVTWIDARSTPIQYYDTMENCYSLDPQNTWPENQSMCCPLGYQCLQDPTELTSSGTPVYKCTPTTVNYCWDYKDEAQCNGYTPEIAQTSIEFLGESCGIDTTSVTDLGNRVCWSEYVCRCSWNRTSSECRAVREDIRECNDINEPAVPEWKCSWTLTSTDDLCETNGVTIFNFQGNPEPLNAPVPPGECEAKQISVPCESLAKLDFFGFFNLILSIFSLITIYFFLNKKSS